jgi:hypothetical protein
MAPCWWRPISFYRNFAIKLELKLNAKADAMKRPLPKPPSQVLHRFVVPVVVVVVVAVGCHPSHSLHDLVCFHLSLSLYLSLRLSRARPFSVHLYLSLRLSRARPFSVHLPLSLCLSLSLSLRLALLLSESMDYHALVADGLTFDRRRRRSRFFAYWWLCGSLG